jgi:hypothetical protein
MDKDGLKEGLACYRSGKVSFLNHGLNDRPSWKESFALSYREFADSIKYSVLQGLLDPVVVPGLFLKSNNVTHC